MEDFLYLSENNMCCVVSIHTRKQADPDCADIIIGCHAGNSSKLTCLVSSKEQFMYVQCGINQFYMLYVLSESFRNE